MTARFWTLLGVVIAAGVVLLIGGMASTVAQEGTGTLPAQPTPERFWTENICPQDVTAPPVTCTFLRTEGSTIRVPLVDPTGYTYGMILIDAGHATFVQATPTATVTPAPALLDLNAASAEEMVARLPRDEYGQHLSLLEANAIVYGRGTAGYFTLDDLLRVLSDGVVAAIRACNCTVQR